MDKNLLKQGIATAEDLGDGLYRFTDSEVLAVLPCRQLKAHEEFHSYRQLSQDHPDSVLSQLTENSPLTYPK